VLEALGFREAPPVDLDGLTAVYAAWCARVPFDNVRKLIALHGGASGPLPGLGADDFFDAWLTHRTGGTCWPSANALHALLDSVGFDSRRVTASMFDQGEPSHGTTIVLLDGHEHLVDSSMLTGSPESAASQSQSPSASQSPSPSLGKLAVFSGVREFPIRVKCATLAWHTLEAALAQKDHPVSTE